MLFWGPQFNSAGQASACGCRDVDHDSELTLDATALARDLRGAYAGESLENLRNRFRNGNLPEICATCQHYGPQFEGEPMHLRIAQLIGDCRIW
jgi:hypothetical protein